MEVDFRRISDSLAVEIRWALGNRIFFAFVPPPSPQEALSKSNLCERRTSRASTPSLNPARSWYRYPPAGGLTRPALELHSCNIFVGYGIVGNWSSKPWQISAYGVRICALKLEFLGLSVVETSVHDVVCGHALDCAVGWSDFAFLFTMQAGWCLKVVSWNTD